MSRSNAVNPITGADTLDRAMSLSNVPRPSLTVEERTTTMSVCIYRPSLIKLTTHSCISPRNWATPPPCLQLTPSHAPFTPHPAFILLFTTHPDCSSRPRMGARNVFKKQMAISWYISFIKVLNYLYHNRYFGHIAKPCSRLGIY